MKLSCFSAPKGPCAGGHRFHRRHGPGRVVYVSCDPATLGRDLKIFKEFGYETRRAVAVDMFPGTRHVESVVSLSKQM